MLPWKNWQRLENGLSLVCVENKGLILVDNKGKVWYTVFMRFLPKIKEKPAMNPKDSSRIVSVETIANSIEKANKVLIALHSGETGRYNEEAIATWERILASLRHRWNDAMIEVQTDGHYYF